MDTPHRQDPYPPPPVAAPCLIGIARPDPSLPSRLTRVSAAAVAGGKDGYADRS